MQDTCSLISTEFDESHGYHRSCYQRFVQHADRLQMPNTDAHTLVRMGRGTSDDRDRTIFKPNCIFCGKVDKIGIKKKGQWTTESTHKSECGGANILTIASEKNDEELLTRI